MSRTDKDAPNWVRALNDPRRVIDHAFGCELSPLNGWQNDGVRHACTVDDPNSDHSYRFCRYWLEDRTRFRYSDGPTAEMLRTGYFGPERAAVRASLLDALRDYNTHGETEADPPTRQTRRSDWYGGWWD